MSLHNLISKLNIEIRENVMSNPGSYEEIEEMTVRKYVELARELIANGADLEEKNSNMDTPIMIAALLGYTELVRFFLEAGAKTVYTKRNALVNAARRGCSDTVEILVDHCPFEDAIITAVDRGCFSVTKTLIEAGADLEIRDEEGNTPFLIAARRGEIEICKLLLHIDPRPHTSDMNEIVPSAHVTNNNGETALMLASKNGYADLVTFLLKIGLDRTAKDNDGWTALDHAIDDDRVCVIDVLNA